MNVLPLTAIYFQRLAGSFYATPLELVVSSSLSGSAFDGSLFEKAIAGPFEVHNESPWGLLERWRETFVLLLIVQDNDLLSSYRDLFVERIDRLRSVALWSEFQLLSIYQAIVAMLIETS